MDTLDEKLREFERAVLALFANTALADSAGLPFHIEVSDSQGNSLLRAELHMQQDRLVYVDEEHIRTH